MSKVDGESIIGGALAFIASFAWRDFFTELIDQYLPENAQKGSILRTKLIYAMVITIFVFVVFYMYMGFMVKVSDIDPVINTFMDPDIPTYHLPRLEKASSKPSFRLKYS